MRVTPRAIRVLARDLGHGFKAEKVILFGSHAWGHPTPDSDVDLLVILKTRQNTADLAADMALALRPPFPVDILVKTPGEVRWRLSERDCFMKDVIERGKVLHEAHHARVG